MPHTKPITTGITYRPQNKSRYQDFFEENINLTQAILKFTSKVISTLIFLKTENMFSINPPGITKT